MTNALAAALRPRSHFRTAPEDGTIQLLGGLRTVGAGSGLPIGQRLLISVARFAHRGVGGLSIAIMLLFQCPPLASQCLGLLVERVRLGLLALG